MLLKRIFDRETGQGTIKMKSEMYSCIYPDSTITDVSIPPVTFVKFTRCGNFLITFSQMLHSVSVYHFHLPVFNCSAAHQDTPSLAWESFFTLSYEQAVTSGPELLCKEFCMFTNDEKYVFAAKLGDSGISCSLCGHPAPAIPRFAN